jgi:hypothetical protein
MSAPKAQVIAKPIAVAVEGLDYFYTLLNQISDPPEFSDVQLWDFCEGGQGFREWLNSFKTLRNFDTVRSLGVIRDAENDAGATTQHLKQCFERCGFSVPKESNVLSSGNPSTAFLVMPYREPSGCLEHAMITAALPHVPMQCADEFLRCVDDSSRNDNWRAKVRVHSLIAASTNPAATLGQSTKFSMWDFEHRALSVMIDFIRMLVSL